MRRFLYKHLANLSFICLPRDKPRQILEGKKRNSQSVSLGGCGAAAQKSERQITHLLGIIRRFNPDLNSRENLQRACLSCHLICLSVSSSLDLIQISDSAVCVRPSDGALAELETGLVMILSCATKITAE